MKICFNNYGYPKQVGCDNGTEFINKTVMNFFESKNIILVKGMVYNPHSQGLIERAHRTVKNALICQYLENKNEFDFDESLNIVVNRYNNMLHSTTKKNPEKFFILIILN